MLYAAHLLKGEGRAPTVLLLISTPGRSIDAVLTDQLKNVLALQELPCSVKRS